MTEAAPQAPAQTMLSHGTPDPSRAPAATPSKRLFIKTYGCQMNVYDSERVADLLAPLGYAMTDTAEDADLVVLNTCHIREKAAEKVYSEIGRMKELRELRAEAGGAPLAIAVAGCVAQAEGAEIMTRAPAVDFVVGPQAYHQLPELIAGGARAPGSPALGSPAFTSKPRGARLAADFAPDDKFNALPTRRRAGGPTAFLTVQEGCDKFCTFCVVPYTRGAEYARPATAILAEARSLAEQGVREITLLGQNVNAYAGPGPDGEVWSLARLARELVRIEGLARLRYTTSHPRDMADDLIAAHGEVEALMPYLHLPVQSGSDRVLRAMNRGHDAASYLRLVERIRAARGDMAVSGDFIVGFPGETDADFEATLQLVQAVGYATAYTFKYSPRPGTPASAMPGQVPEPVKTERLATLQKLLEAQTRAFGAATVGRRLPVLMERRGRQPGQLIGRSPYLQSVWAEAPEAALGQIVEMDILEVRPNSLSGRLAFPSPSRGGSGWEEPSGRGATSNASPHPKPPLEREGMSA